MIRQPRLLPLVLALALAPSAYAGDTIVCVTDNVGFKTALVNASIGGVNDGKDNVIRLAAGSYVKPPLGQDEEDDGVAFTYFGAMDTGGIVIEGGWNSDCSTHTNNASLTTLDGTLTHSVLSMHRIAGYQTVRWLTIQNGKSDLGHGAGLVMSPTNPFVEHNGLLTITDNIIRNNVSGDTGGAIWILNYGPSPFIYLENNVIVGNHSDMNYGAAQIVGGGIPVYLINNTIANNTAGPAAGPATSGGVFVHTEISNGGSNTFELINNIFWNNSVSSLTYESTGAIFDNNDIDVMSGDAPLSTTGGISVDPMFVDGTSDFHLATGSPLFHISPSGDRSALDPEGHGYPIFGKVDIGAYSETIFADGFDDDNPT
jgi:hypothetical protein